MSEWRLVRTAVWREIYSRRKAFLITTALALTLVLGGMATASLIIDEDEAPTIGVGVLWRNHDDLESAIEDRLGPEVGLEMVYFDSRSGGIAALETSDIDALVTGPHTVLWGPATTPWVTDVVTSAMIEVNVSRAARRLEVDEEDLAMFLSVSGETIELGERDTSVEALAAISVIVMFIAILSYGQWIAYGVVEEKANRVAELILGALSPGQLLTAKMLSLGGMGLAQLTIVGTAALIAGSTLTDIVMPPVGTTTLVWLLAWFIIGFAFYGSLYAASGSLAADTQEAGSMITPLNILPGVGYVVGLISFSAGSELIPRVLSLIPFFAPMVMPGRMARGTVEWWEVALSIGLMVVFTLLMVRFAANVYLGGMTQATRQVGWRQAFRGGREFGATG